MWSKIVLDRFHGQPKSAMLRFHTQTGGATLTAQQPQNNIVRTALEALAAVLGGTQSLHTNGFDEALALPTERSARIALRTQQIIGYESGVVETVDPLGGSYFVETMTNEIEQRAWEYIDKIEGMGGAVQAIEAGFYQDEIAEAAYKISRGIEDGTRTVVGVNKFAGQQDDEVEIQHIEEQAVKRQLDRLNELRSNRESDAVTNALKAVEDAAQGTDNLLPPMKEALRLRATLGEVSNTLRTVFGEYQPTH
jgi:methylmalonyl-CoA mutase N-terminal domain/subunit